MKEKLFGNIHELTDDEKRVERLEKKLFIMKYGTISFVFIFCMLLSLSSFTMAHEQVHVQICQNGGGHAEVTYTPLFLGGYTICSIQQTESQYYLHSMNEIYGYNTLSAILGGWLMIFVLIIVLSFNHEDR